MGNATHFRLRSHDSCFIFTDKFRHQHNLRGRVVNNSRLETVLGVSLVLCCKAGHTRMFLRKNSQPSKAPGDVIEHVRSRACAAADVRVSWVRGHTLDLLSTSEGNGEKHSVCSGGRRLLFPYTAGHTHRTAWLRRCPELCLQGMDCVREVWVSLTVFPVPIIVWMEKSIRALSCHTHNNKSDDLTQTQYMHSSMITLTMQLTGYDLL